MAKEPQPLQDFQDLNSVQLDYIKSNIFRVIHVDGAIGAIAPSGMLQMGLFSEREAIPRSVRHSIDDEGRLGEILSVSGRSGYVREVDVWAMMSIDTARELIEWLQGRVAEWERDAEEGQ